MAETMSTTSQAEAHEAALCPVRVLALDAARQLDAAGSASCDRDLDAAFGRLLAIRAQACSLAPASPEGAQFLIATVLEEMDDLPGADDDDAARLHGRTVRRRITSALYGVRHFLEAHFGPIEPRGYFEITLPDARDPHTGAPRHG